jgi:hypothetical protein
MRAMKVMSMFVLATLLLTFAPSMVMAAEPPPPEAQVGVDKEPQPAPQPPDDVKVYTVTGGSKSGLSGPGGGYAILTAIMNYYHQIWWYSRAGSEIDPVSGTSGAYAYATLKMGSWSSSTTSCYAFLTTSCTTYTGYYLSSGLVTAQADTTVYWSAGGFSQATEYVNHTF